MKNILVVILAPMFVFFSSMPAIHADILVRTDGLAMAGKVISQDAGTIVFQLEGDPAATSLHLDRTIFPTVLLTDEHGALLSPAASSQPASSQPATQPVRSWHVPPEPAAPPVIPSIPGKPTYYLIPLHGEVGATIQASILEKSLADAVLRKPTVVVLDISSPGGLVRESEELVKVIHHYNKRLRIVALAEQDLSAAAIFTLSVREIYLKPSGTIGAATSFVPDNPNLSAKVEEKMQSAWRAVARNSAEEGGHEPLLANAMIDNDMELHLETVDGKPVVKEGPGENMLCKKGKILTLTSHEAVACGLAAGDAEDIDDLGTELKLANWTECKGLGTLLADYIPTRVEAYKTEMKTINLQFDRNMADAISNDPANGTTTSRIVSMQPGLQPHYPAPVYTPGVPRSPRVMVPQVPQRTETVRILSTDVRSGWKTKSITCVVALQRAEENIGTAIEVAAAFDNRAARENLKDLLTTISTVRASVYDDRNKYGTGVGPQTIDRLLAKRPETPAPPPPALTSPPSAGNTRAPATEVVHTGSPTTLPADQQTNGKLDKSFAATIAKAISDKTYQDSTVLGGAFAQTPFADIDPSGGILIGFRYALGTFVNRPILKFIQPIYLNADGETLGQGYGETPDETQVLKAKPGYAVGSMTLAGGGGMDSIILTFMRIKDGKLDPDDNYDSEKIGGSGGGTPRLIGGDGTPIIGICGRCKENNSAFGLGIVLLSESPTAKPKIIRATRPN